MERWSDGAMERWRDGGLSDSSLRDRGDVLTIRSFAQIKLSDDMGIRVAMKEVIEDEREFRRIERDANVSTGTLTIIEKTRRACKKPKCEAETGKYVHNHQG
jgi:hypothetical protein